MSNLTQLPYHTLDTAPEEARPILEEAQSKYDMIPNLHARMAEAPSLLRAYWDVSEAFGSSSLSMAEQQVVLLAVSARNGCEYCVGAHSTVADMAKVPTEVTDAVRDGEPIDDARLQALRRFAEAVVEHRGWVPEEQVDAFLDAGFERQQVLEVVLGVGMKTLSNYTNHLAGTELDEAFSGRKWQKKD